MGKHLESFVRKKLTGYEVTTRAPTHLMWQNAPSLRAHLLPERRTSESNNSSYVTKPLGTETTERPRWCDELVGDDGSDLFASQKKKKKKFEKLSTAEPPLGNRARSHTHR